MEMHSLFIPSNEGLSITFTGDGQPQDFNDRNSASRNKTWDEHNQI